MAFCIGTDEAGYGPNLGPLVISATLWRVPDDVSSEHLYRALQKCVTCKPPAKSSKRLFLADSKAVYAPATGLEQLERGVLAALAAFGLRPGNFRELLTGVGGDDCDAEAVFGFPWHAQTVELPLACEAAALDEARRRFADGLSAAGVELLAVRSRALFPQEFNAEVDRLDNKSTLLTRETLKLVRELLPRCAGRVTIDCDKHGGRNSYAPALQQHVCDALVRVARESRAESAYHWSDDARTVEIAFRVEGESRLPTALASMASKYLRETAMCAWNRFWLEHLPDLRPTAGYAVDSRRFRADIAATAERLRLDERTWWRNR